MAPFLKTWESHSSGTSPRAKDSLKISASIGEISLKISASIGEFSSLHSLSPSISLDESSARLKVVVWYFSIHSNFKSSFTNKRFKHDQTPRSVASELVLYCLPMSHKKTLGLYE